MPLPSETSSNGPRSRDLRRQPARVVAACLLHAPVAVEAETQQRVVLRDDLRPRAREVQRERRHVAAEVVDVEDEILRQRRAVAPDGPADARVDEPVLVARGVDRRHAGDAEVPFEIGIDERGDESAGGRVDVDRHVDAAARPARGRAPRAISRTGSYAPSKVDPRIATTPIVCSSHCAAAPSAVRHVRPADRDEPRLDVPVTTELLPADLHVGAHDEVRPVIRRGPRRGGGAPSGA